MQNEQVIDGVTYLVSYVKKEDDQKKQSKRGDNNWYFDTIGDIIKDESPIKEVEKPFCYPTEADCIKARDKILALYRIKTYAEDKRGEFIPDWIDRYQSRYYIGYDHINEEYFIDSHGRYQHINIIYLASFENCAEIREKFKDDLDILFDIKG